MCGLGVAVGCRMKHAKSALAFKGFKVFNVWPRGGCWLQDEGFGGFGGFKGWQTAGLDAHKKPLMCGLGVPVGCRMKHAKGLFKRPIRSH